MQMWPIMPSLTPRYCQSRVSVMGLNWKTLLALRTHCQCSRGNIPEERGGRLQPESVGEGQSRDRI